MNRTKARELLPVITAFANGEDVEIKEAAGGAWMPTCDPAFSHYFSYRIAPKPKTCERWCFAVFYSSGATAFDSNFTEHGAQESKRLCQESVSDATFSPIVRVEFVEEKTA